MGVSESSLASTSRLKESNDGITTISERLDSTDPILEKLKTLQIAGPILKNLPSEDTSLSEILVRKQSAASSALVNPNVIIELLSVYKEWVEKRTLEISAKQNEVENKIDVTDALATKLLQRFNYSASSMKITSQHLSQVHELQVETGELKGRLTEVNNNLDALCKRLEIEYPELLPP